MAEGNNNIPQARECPKDCRRCSMPQQIYCTTSLMFNSYEVMGKVLERLQHIEENLRVMQGAGSDLVNPQTDKLEYQPQSASGGENRLPT